MKLIDLHVHSTASDGSLTPTEVVNRAAGLGLTAMALTDHDTVSGIDEALKAAKYLDMEVIPGIEVSCIYKEKEIHILGLYIDHTNPELLSFLKEASRKRYDRNMEMLAAFRKDGFALTEEDLFCGNPKTIVTRAHFARALLKRPKILILDDSTSAVDTATEAKIRESLYHDLKDTTKIIIAQRISSVQEADQILVLEDGKIIGHGTHEELLKTCEAYSEIYTTQIGNQSIRAGEEAAV